MKNTRLRFISLICITLLIILVAGIYFVKKNKSSELVTTEIYKNLDSNRSNSEEVRKTLQNFLTKSINDGFAYNDLRSIDLFYDKNINNKSLEADLLYYIGFTRSAKILYEYENNIKNLEEICSSMDEFFSLQENPNSTSRNVPTDISLNTKTSLRVLSITYQCKDISDFNNLFNKAIGATGARVLQGDNTIFIWFYDENQVDSNVKWLSEKFDLDINELTLNDSQSEAIRIISLDKNFAPTKYKQFKSNQNTDLYKYRYNINTFYVKDNQLYWTENNELAL